MARFVIKGGNRLSGEIKIAGFKNAALPLLAATLLSEEKSVISNVPEILDVRNFLEMLKDLGSEYEFSGRTVSIRTRKIFKYRPKREYVSAMRASILLLGSLLNRIGRVNLAYPGGDLIGARPIDVHLRGFKALGAKVKEGKVIQINSKGLSGANLYGESSVTGTENLIMAALAAKGKSVVKLAAQEPHIVSLCEFLRKMGADIHGIGTHTLTLRGKKKLHGASFAVIPDMIEAGSFAVMGAATNSHIALKNVRHDHLDAVYNKLWEMGVQLKTSPNLLEILPSKKPYRAARIRTGLYPNLATDLQPPFGVLASLALGKSIIHDWVFEGRFGYLYELKKMGADVNIIDPHRAEITGPVSLKGCLIDSRDIRSGITLVIAGLVARGVTTLNNVQHLDRGFEDLEGRLNAVGADIKRIN